MAEGFKGKQIEIFDVLLSEKGLEFTVEYLGEDGLVHGVMQHKLPVPNREDEPELAQACASLLQAIKTWTERKHFDSRPSSRVATTPTQRELRGISEAVQRADEDPALFGEGDT